MREVLEYILTHLVVFACELLVAEWLFCYFLPRRRGFWVRFVLSVGVYCAVFLFFPGERFLIANMEWNGFNWYFQVVFLCSIAQIYLCCAVSLKDVFFYALTGWSIQHICSSIIGIVRVLSGIELYSLLLYLLELTVDLIVFPIVFFTLGRRMRERTDIQLNQKRILILGLFILIIVIVMGQVRYNLQGGASKASLILDYSYAALCCVTLLGMQFGLFESGKQEKEKKEMEHLLCIQGELHDKQKALMDYIDIKCHDLKKQIALIRYGAQDKSQETLLKEMEQAIQEYGNLFKTGNEALDILLAEKTPVFECNQIRFSLIVDGQQLSFMTPSDIYSLIGNGLDNAIECVVLEEEEKRYIYLNIGRRDSFLHILIENPSRDVPVIKDGLPRTTKGNERNHGYGMRSMRYVVKKYNGEMSVLCAHGMFTVSVILPIVTD